MNLDKPELKALRDYLDAVEEALAASGSAPEDIAEIKSEICAHVATQLGESPHSPEAVEEVVRQLDSPESYREEPDDESGSHTILRKPLKRKLRPWMIIVGGLGILALLLIGLLIVFATIFIQKRNEIVVAEKQIDQAAAQVQVVLQRRYDLIPNLVETVKGYAAHESQTLRAVTELRAQWSQAESPEQKRALSIKLEPQIGKIMAIAEDYPDLKANQNFLMLQTQLEGTENRIAVERRRFNLMLRDYNALIDLFPGNLVAMTLNYEPREQYFEALPEAGTSPKVDFSPGE
ncbi:LemA family protein [Puniceicoccus vermicola]|nr:LemA family protein [Puniceicoccus vermicola]